MKMERIKLLACVVTLNLKAVVMAQNNTFFNRLTDGDIKEHVTTHPASEYAVAENERGIDFKILVYDSKEKIPIGLARIVLQSGKKVIAQDATNTTGQVWFRDIQSGSYTLTAWFVGYQVFKDSILIDENHTTYTIDLQSLENQVQGVEVVAQHELGVSNIDMGTGNQTFESETYHPPPTAQMTNLIQQNAMGAARAPTSEVHIRGQHGEFTYYIDGIPIPLGVFGGLNEVVDPKVIDRATFITGGFPAEYGGQMSAIIDLNNRVPTGTFHLDASIYAGSYLVFNGTKPFSPGNEVAAGASSAIRSDTLGGRIGPFRALNSNGQALSISDHIDKLGFYISGSRQETDRRIDTPVPNLFHDHGFDYFLYGKFDYILSDVEYVTANLNFGRTSTQVPYDPNVQIASDLQETTNSFQAVSYFRAMNSQNDQEENLFIGAYARQGGLIYTPGDIDPPNFQFAGDSTQSYRLSEDRNFTTIGIRSTYDDRFSHWLMVKVGFNISSTTGTEQFSSFDSVDNRGPEILTDFTGSDFGIFTQAQWHALDWTSFELGLRYDQHIAPNVDLQRQISPRLRWNFLIDENRSAYVYYGRLFMPTNIEGLRSIAQHVSNSVTPTYPERSDFYEAVYTHRFSSGLKLKTAGFFKQAQPFTDDATLGNTAIKTPFNISTVRTTGIELALSYSDPTTPLSCHLNSSVIHAIGSGPLTGGFLPPSSDGPATDLDHDQRLSIVTDINYQPQDWFFNLEATYGSGLSNGHPEDISSYKTGLIDFNQAAHTTPYWILNCSAGRTFHFADGSSFEPSIYIANLLDHAHLLKGAYTTGASWEERRNVILKIAVHM
jgi:TonB dependent receptor